jgi:small-conductance mechanosensitive channel
MGSRLCAVTVCAGVIVSWFLVEPVGAQMLPGTTVEEEQPGETPAEDANVTDEEASGRPLTFEERRKYVKDRIAEDQPGLVGRLYLTYLSEYSPYRGTVLALVTLLVLVLLKGHFTRALQRYMRERAYKEENVRRFMRSWGLVWKFVIGVFVIVALSGSLRWLGLSAAFFGMMLGWSLQAPVTGVAAWLMVLLKRPFRIGDRVIIGGVIGDVTDITLTHVILNQVGGTVAGEERSGRGVLIPNATLFQQTIMNYTLEEKFMLDEVPVRLTFDSDWDRAKEILLQAAREVTDEIIRETGQEPFIRCEFFDAGVLARLRYQTIPARRQELSSRIVERVLHAFKDAFPDVKFCFPHSVVRYRLEGTATAPEPAEG